MPADERYIWVPFVNLNLIFVWSAVDNDRSYSERVSRRCDVGIRVNVGPLMFNSLCRDYRAISLCIALKIQCTKNYFTDNSCGESSRGSFSPSPPNIPRAPCSREALENCTWSTRPHQPLRPLVSNAGRYIFCRVF